jgi:hypothetical protein
MANLTFVKTGVRNQLWFLKVYFFKCLQRFYTQAPRPAFLLKTSHCTAGQALFLKPGDNGGKVAQRDGNVILNPFSLKAPAESPRGSLFPLKWDTAVHHVRLCHKGVRLWCFWLSGAGFHLGAPQAIWRKPKKVHFPLSGILYLFPTPVSSWPAFCPKFKSCAK